MYVHELFVAKHTVTGELRLFTISGDAELCYDKLCAMAERVKHYVVDEYVIVPISVHEKISLEEIQIYKNLNVH